MEFVLVGPEAAIDRALDEAEFFGSWVDGPMLDAVPPNGVDGESLVNPQNAKDSIDRPDGTVFRILMRSDLGGGRQQLFVVAVKS